MGFFDNILDEQTQTNQVASLTPVMPAPVSETSDDGSFLIIQDEIKTEDIPNSAVSFFEPEAAMTDASSAVLEVVSPQEIHLEPELSEPIFDGSADASAEIPSEKIEKKAEAAILPSFVSETPKSSTIESQSLKDLLEWFMKDLASRSESYDPQIAQEMKTVEEINAEIAILKQKAKTCTENASRYATEKAKVEEVKKDITAKLETVA